MLASLPKPFSLTLKKILYCIIITSLDQISRFIINIERISTELTFPSPTLLRAIEKPRIVEDKQLVIKLRTGTDRITPAGLSLSQT